MKDNKLFPGGGGAGAGYGCGVCCEAVLISSSCGVGNSGRKCMNGNTWVWTNFCERRVVAVDKLVQIRNKWQRVWKMIDRKRLVVVRDSIQETRERRGIIHNGDEIERGVQQGVVGTGVHGDERLSLVVMGRVQVRVVMHGVGMKLRRLRRLRRLREADAGL